MSTDNDPPHESNDTNETHQAPFVQTTEYDANGNPVEVIRLTNFSLADHLRGVYGSAAEKMLEFFPKNPYTKKKPSSPPPPYMTPPADGACPIDKLPNELLADIFILSAEMQAEAFTDPEFIEDSANDRDDDDSDEDFGVDVEILVSHVNRRWRSVALATPSLWNIVSFCEGPPFNISKLYIARSREAPLDITIDCTADSDGDNDDDEEDEDEGDEDEGDVMPPLIPTWAVSESAPPQTSTTPSDAAAAAPPVPKSQLSRPRPSGERVFPEELPAIRDLILPHIARWRSFELLVSSYAVMHKTLLALQDTGPASELQELALYDHGEHDTDDEHEVFQPASLRGPIAPFKGVAPNLHSISLWGVHLDWDACTFFSGLDILALAYHARDVRPSYETFVRMLTSSPKLRRLSLTVSGPGGEPASWPSTSPTQQQQQPLLPSVEHLLLAFFEPVHTLALLTRLAPMPSLKHLTLDADPDDFAAVLHHITQTLAPRLETLKIGGLQADVASVRELYASLHALQALQLDAISLAEPFIELLLEGTSEAASASISIDTAAQAPLLRSLKVLTTTGIEGAHMCKIVEAREAAGVPLKRVAMAADDYVEEKEEIWLRKHVELARFIDQDNEFVDDEDDGGFVIDSDGFTDEQSGSESEDEDEDEDEDDYSTDSEPGGESDMWGPD